MVSSLLSIIIIIIHNDDDDDDGDGEKRSMEVEERAHQSSGKQGRDEEQHRPHPALEDRELRHEVAVSICW